MKPGDLVQMTDFAKLAVFTAHGEKASMGKCGLIIDTDASMRGYIYVMWNACSAYENGRMIAHLPRELEVISERN